MAWLGTKVFNNDDFYNNEDFNRENENVEFLRNKLNQEGYNISFDYPIRAFETKEGFPFVSYINDLRRNINKLISYFYTNTNAPITINENQIQKFGHIQANELEDNPQQMYDLIGLMEESYMYRHCGTFSSGQEVDF